MIPGGGGAAEHEPTAHGVEALTQPYGERPPPILRRATGEDPFGMHLIGDVRREAAVERAQQEAASGGAPIGADSLARLGAHFGHDLSNARVHSGPEAQAIAGSVGARAFAMGSHVFVGAGESAEAGEHNPLLMHELAHVVQHERGETGGAGPLSRTGDPIERAADDLAAGTGAHARISTPAASGGAAAAPVLRWEREGGQATGPLTAAEMARLRQLLLDIGISSSELGDLSDIARWPDARIDNALRVLRNQRARLVPTWNAHQDDLGESRPDGPRGRRRYHNVLEYTDHLNDVGEGDYVAYRRAMPRIVFAGSSMEVNAHSIYFAAAAQLGMDRRGRDQPGRDESGHGHWYPVGGIMPMIRQMIPILRRMVQHGRAIDGGGAVLNTMRDELERMFTLLEAQRAGRDLPGNHANESLEPAVRDYLLERRATIRGVLSSASDGTASITARELLLALGATVDSRGRGGSGTLPGGEHESGAADPHGTAHAEGIAFDLQYGHDGRNLHPVPDRAWDFINYVIARHPEVPGLGGTTRLGPGAPPPMLRLVSQLMVAHGHSAYVELRGPAFESDHADQQADHFVAAERTELRNARAYVTRAIDNRIVAVETAMADSSTPTTCCDGLRTVLRALRRDHGGIATSTISELTRIVNERAADLDRVNPGRPRDASSARPFDHLGPEEGSPSLDTARETLSHLAPGISQQSDRDARTHARAALGQPGVENWVNSASRHPFFDQSDNLIQSIDDVHSHPHDREHPAPRNGARESFLYSGHHWAVMRESTLRDPAERGRAMQEDMHHRTPHDLERIMSIMAESRGGRTALFAEPPDQVLIQAFEHELTATVAHTMLDRVRARVVEPYVLAHQRGGTIGDELRASMRDLGLLIAPPDESAAH